MNGVPWWLTVPAVLAVLIAAGFAVLAAWIRWNAPAMQARWHAAVQAEIARSRVLEEEVR